MSNAVLEKKTDTLKRAVKAYNSFFSKTDTLCAELCNHAEGSCDEITGKCERDWSDRSVEWCLEGSYGYSIKWAMCDALSHFSDLMYIIFKIE